MQRFPEKNSSRNFHPLADFWVQVSSYSPKQSFQKWPSRFWKKTLRKTKESKQAFVGQPKNVCLASRGVLVSHLREQANLIARAAQSDASAVRAIIALCNRRLYRIARSVVRNDHEAEDIVQAAYGRAFTHLREFRGESDICTWLARIVLNEALGRRRRSDTAGHMSLDDQAYVKSLPLADEQPDPERMVAQREIYQLLENAVDDLPQNFRMVLVMRTLEGMSVEETASLLRIRPETVKTRLHRARALLRARLELDIGPLLTNAFPFEGERCMRLTAKVLSRLKSRGRGPSRIEQYFTLSGRACCKSRPS
jgi:RNA polymerase sigma-70 factor (ECF subfamily)